MNVVLESNFISLCEISHETSMIFDDVKKSDAAIDDAGCIYRGIPAVPEGSTTSTLTK